MISVANRPTGAELRSDVPAYERSLGFASDRLPSKTFQGTPMRHRGVHVGNFHLVEKERAEAFTDEEEEILVLFASKAATAIANPRTYRAEQRTRADLEALIETSPVGVVVFDVGTGRPVSLNREVRRIVERLRMPGRTAEDLLGILTCRFADGREIALGELPLAGVLSGAETARAEEIVLTTPDGRSVTTLSTQRRSTPRTARSRRWWSPCRTSPRFRSWNAGARSSSAWSATSCGCR